MKYRLKLRFFRLVLFAVYIAGPIGNICCKADSKMSLLAQRGKETFDSLYSHYSVENSHLLREHFPFDATFSADYLADENVKQGNPYSYLWPFSGTLSAAKALYDATGNKEYLDFIDFVILPGLECYRDTLRKPMAYSSYIDIESTVPSDRFYDDNDWIGIDLTELYNLTGNKKYLEESENIWKFIESGIDHNLGGGIYWCEQKKYSKNTCSNAPAAVFALRLFKATNDSSYLSSAIDLYEWTQTNLRDSSDGLYFDNKKLNGRIGRTKYAYNSGQMLEAASILYVYTNNIKYLQDANEIAENAARYFINGLKVNEEDGEFNLFSQGNIWFTAIMMRGFLEYGKIADNTTYMDSFIRNLNHAWDNMRDSKTGLFNEDWTGREKKEKKWLLTQAAMVEMFANAAQYSK